MTQRLQEKTDSSGNISRISICQGCRSNEGVLRRCTGQVLCEACRKLPDFKIITHTEVAKKTLLSKEDLLPFRAGFVTSPVQSVFVRVPVYFVKDLESFLGPEVIRE